MPLMGYITYYCLTHMHSDAISAQLERSSASSFLGLKRRKPFNPAGDESQIGKTLCGPVVGTALCAPSHVIRPSAIT